MKSIHNKIKHLSTTTTTTTSTKTTIKNHHQHHNNDNNNNGNKKKLLWLAERLNARVWRQISKKKKKIALLSAQLSTASMVVVEACIGTKAEGRGEAERV